MSESPDTPAHQALAALTLVVDELTALVDDDGDATLDADLLHQSERAISMSIAMLVATREEAATALEASVAGAAPRDEPALARDLLLIADALQQALTRGIALADESNA